MKITLFGGTGTTGLLLVEQALAAGHRVTVYARNPAKITRQDPNLHVLAGELTETDKIESAIKGADAVISLLGPRNLSKELPISKGTKSIIDSMQKNRVKRLVAAVSSSYMDKKDRFQIGFAFGILALKLIARNTILKDIEETGKLIAECPLDWTMIRLPQLSNQQPKGKVIVGYMGDGKVNNFFLSRGDLAAFLLQELNDKTYQHQAPIISN